MLVDSKHLRHPATATQSLLLIQLPALLLFLVGVVTATLSGYSWTQFLLSLALWAGISGLGISVGYHRVFSHRTHIERKAWLEGLLLGLGALACQGSSIFWVSKHRKHHVHSDEKGQDPHTPNDGFAHALGGWVFRVDLSPASAKTTLRLVGDLYRLPVHRILASGYVHYLYTVWGLALLIDWRLFVTTYGLILPICYMQEHLVNAFCHSPKFGYRVRETNDLSRNVWWLGYFGWGQGWHNYHHAEPAKFNFASKPFEFDPSCLFLPLLSLGAKRNASSV